MPNEMPAGAGEALATARRAGRLSPLGRQEIAPWQRAHELTRCFLYWMPVSGFPIPLAQRAWLLQFLARLASTASEKLGLRREFFLQYKTVIVLLEAFQRTALEFQPLLGLGRRPGAPITPLPTPADMEELVKSGKDFDFKKNIPDFCYWFLKKRGEKQSEMFWGSGGVSMIFAQPDPATAAPPLPFSPAFRQKSRLFQKLDVDGVWESAAALNDGFQAKSKELFGAGLENHPQYPGLPFILPILQASDFFQQSEQESSKWFQLFDIYVRESPEDGGVLLASKTDFDDALSELLVKMREDGFTYPEGR